MDLLVVNHVIAVHLLRGISDPNPELGSIADAAPGGLREHRSARRRNSHQAEETTLNPVEPDSNSGRCNYRQVGVKELP